jgi:hypothetical protein
MTTHLLALLALAAAACTLYTEKPVLTDRADAEPVDAHPPAPDAAYGACGVPIDCPSPTDSSFVSLCGQIVDVETNEPITAAGWTGAACDPLAPTADGPCALRIAFHDALSYVSGASEPLGASVVEILDCGEFRGIDIERPFSGMVSVAVDDAEGVPDNAAPTAITVTTAPRERRTGIRAFTTRRATDEAWTATAGQPFGAQTFAERGVFVAVFRYRGQPMSGVQIAAGGVVRPALDYYFGDLGSARTTIDPARTATGANGAGLLVDTPLGAIWGEGAELPGCEWASELGASVPGAVQVAVKDATLIGDDQTPCR